MSSITSVLFSLTLSVAVTQAVSAGELDTKALSTAIDESISLGEKAQYWQEQARHFANTGQQKLAQLYLAEFEIRKQQRALAHLSSELEQREQTLKQMQLIEQALSLQLEVWYAELENRVRQDMPFAKEERQRRLQLLRQTLDNPQLSLSAKFRQFSDALQVEVKQGNDRQLTNEIIQLKDTAVAVTTLRVGRLAWYAITNDKRQGYLYQRDTARWQALPESQLPQLISAFDIARQQALPQWQTLPVSVSMASSGPVSAEGATQ